MKWRIRLRVRMPGDQSAHFTEDAIHYLLRWTEQWTYHYTGPRGMKGQGHSIGHLIKCDAESRPGQ